MLPNSTLTLESNSETVVTLALQTVIHYFTKMWNYFLFASKDDSRLCGITGTAK